VLSRLDPEALQRRFIGGVEEVRRLFEAPLPKGYSEQRSDAQVEGGQGRIESRHYRHILLGKPVLPAAQGWPAASRASWK
jgi:hypothetical protein